MKLFKTLLISIVVVVLAALAARPAQAGQRWAAYSVYKNPQTGKSYVPKALNKKQCKVGKERVNLRKVIEMKDYMESREAPSESSNIEPNRLWDYIPKSYGKARKGLICTDVESTNLLGIKLYSFSCVKRFTSGKYLRIDINFFSSDYSKRTIHNACEDSFERSASALDYRLVLKPAKFWQ